MNILYVEYVLTKDIRNCSVRLIFYYDNNCHLRLPNFQKKKKNQRLDVHYIRLIVSLGNRCISIACHISYKQIIF